MVQRWFVKTDYTVKFTRLSILCDYANIPQEDPAFKCNLLKPFGARE